MVVFEVMVDVYISHVVVPASLAETTCVWGGGSPSVGRPCWGGRRGMESLVGRVFHFCLFACSGDRRVRESWQRAVRPWWQDSIFLAGRPEPPSLFLFPCPVAACLIKHDVIPRRHRWLESFAADCRCRIVSLLGHEFQGFDCTTGKRGNHGNLGGGGGGRGRLFVFYVYI